ncbi:flavin reductase family protein [Pseudomonas sp. PS02288]|uniref:flavin reductase family protein n=1 Tax=Pseudomonas sp. PS02288 TaxID=2991443 RepID=UPI00249AA832|nr:flavin reductase family protein [Pseudomonas sp. PS02288]
MQIDFSALTSLEAYRWMANTVTPRPIAWVSTLSADGVANLAPFSFFQVISDTPPILMVNISTRGDGSLKDSMLNLQETGELVIQLVCADQVEAMNASSATLPRGTSEFEHCGIASEASVRVAPRRVKGAPVAFECRVAQLLPYPAHEPNCTLVFAEILYAHIDQSVLDEQGRIDAGKLDIVGRLGGKSYSYTRERFDLTRPN